MLKTLKAKEYIVEEIEKLDDKIEYMGKVKELLEQFKDWFTKKINRKHNLKVKENNQKIKNN